MSSWPRDRCHTSFSPAGHYVSIWYPPGGAVADGRTGEVLLEVTGDTAIAWPGGGSPERYLLHYSGDEPTRLHDLATGHEIELRPDPNRHAYPPESVRVLPDGRIALARGDTGTIDLLDAAGNPVRRLYERGRSSDDRSDGGHAERAR